jgi:hypothetical protein
MVQHRLPDSEKARSIAWSQPLSEMPRAILRERKVCFTGHAYVGVFDRAFNKLKVVESARKAEQVDVFNVLTDYEIALMTSFD